MQNNLSDNTNITTVALFRDNLLRFLSLHSNQFRPPSPYCTEEYDTRISRPRGTDSKHPQW